MADETIIAESASSKSLDKLGQSPKTLHARFLESGKDS